MLLAELVVEAFGDPLDVERFASRRVTSTIVSVSSSARLKGDRLKLLDQRLSRLALVIGVLSTSGWLSRLALNPLPNLCRSIFIEV